MKTACINGINVEYQLDGSGEPLLLIHGGQGDRNSFDNIIPDLSKKFTVLSFDQRGSGNSSKPDTGYTISLLADDAKMLMDHVGFKSAHIFGISMGGLIAEDLAIRYPNKIRSAILGCTLPGGWSHALTIEHTEDVLTAFSSDETITPEVRARALARVAFAPGFAEKNLDIVETLVDQRRRKPIHSLGITRRLEAVKNYDAYNQLHDICCKTLVITGKDDQLVAWQNSKVIAKQIPHAKLVVLESAGHLFWIEQKEKTLNEIYSFIC